ncbi:transcriptional regulator, IclR family [Meinhardsimonia xiamenensis]|uniref:Transcriptional regulator, IclR family n=1 Tax=Meinhardsimonia xiamenensis TaxID=990712 RepID=A0A1G9AQ24_9RHOB|nr:IclR family transcriptional regulator [Meinhardsimonia xiamenensis]PRX35292.1 IclR family transcriptional regulator [Meinhardsimonia xiamenensis]SDK29341.1 transcriptional regulator, IclR family [Meinhardsimonia xiamenensis]
MAKPERSDGTVGKALEILDAVASKGRPVRFSELLAESPLPKATLYRLLQTLTNQGLLAYDAELHTYTLGLRLVRLAHQAWKQSSLAPIARPHIDRLAARTGETIHLAQMDQGQVLYVDKRNAAQPIEMFAQAGKVGPGYCTGIGKAIMAFLEPAAREAAIARQAFLRHTPNTITDPQTLAAELERIRAEGVAFDREEHEPGIICIASPILSGGAPGGRVIGGVSITTSTARRSLEELAALRPDLEETARAIGADAAHWQFPA